MQKFKLMSGAALAIAGLVPAWGAHAQTAPANNAIQEVIVTATKTGATNLQKTAVVVDAITGNDLVRDDIKNLKDLGTEVPALKISTNNVNAQIYIRGVGGYQNNESDVSVYLDGVYVSRVISVLQTEFNDLDRIEVLEGPQGTIYGRNSVGGAIDYISKVPPKTFTFQDTLNVGNYSLLDESVSVGGPLADNIQGTLAFSHVQHDGYLHNVVPGVGNPDAANRTGLKGQVRWEATANITDTVRADYFYTHENWATNDTLLEPTTTVSPTFLAPIANSIIGNYHDVAVDTMPVENFIGYGLSNELDWKLNNQLTLKSVSALRTAQDYNYQDLDATEVSYSYGYSFGKEYQLSQEFNLINDFGVVSGVLGLYYYDEGLRFIGDTWNPGGVSGRPVYTSGSETYQNTLIPSRSEAAFFEETYHVTPTIGLTVGGRYTQDFKGVNTYNTSYVFAPGLPINRTLPPSTAQFTYPFVADVNQVSSKFTPKFAANWQATPNAMVYASATNGYKSGGLSYTARNLQGISFGPENLWAYEIGAKTDWFDHTLRVNVAAFHYVWQGLQFNSLIAPQVSAVSNAGGATLDGLEWNITSKPVDGLTLNFNTTLLNSDYTDFKNFAPQGGYKLFFTGDPRWNAAAGTYNATGNQLVNAPHVSLALSAQKDFDLADGADLFVRGEYQYTSLTYFDPTNEPVGSRPAYSLVNASIGYSPAHSHWTVALWGKNLGDTQYINGINAASIITAPVGDPRTFGVRINYTY